LTIYVFTGVGVALVTLLDESGRVDTASTVALAADLVDRGMHGVSSPSSAGWPSPETRMPSAG
jgi:dihydrodipicolinate synthase/N-acetylneuraminate lyase